MGLSVGWASEANANPDKMMAIALFLKYFE